MPNTVRTCALVVGLMLAGPLMVLPGSAVFADNAVVLPKGYGVITFENRYRIPHSNRFDDNGNSVPIGAPLSTDLDPLRPLLDPGGMTGMSPLGFSDIDLERHFYTLRTLIAYGITDRLTAGLIIPYIKNKIKVNRFNVNGSTVGITPAAINAALGATLGYKPIATSESEGLGDMEFGARYQYYRSDLFRAAFTGIVVAPTGEEDDIDNLIDEALGDGNWAVRFQFQQDLMRQEDGLGKRLGFPGAGDYFVTTIFEYLWNLPDDKLLRICDPALPLCATKAEVTKKLGDIIKAEIQGNLGVLTDGLIVTGGYNWSYQFKSHHTGSAPAGAVPLGDLAQGTDRMRHEYQVGITYTTIPLVVAGKFPLPLVGAIQYRDTFAGHNFFDSKTLWMTVTSYFDVAGPIGAMMSGN